MSEGQAYAVFMPALLVGAVLVFVAAVVWANVAEQRKANCGTKEPTVRACRCGRCDTGDDLDVAEAADVTPAVVAGSDLDRARRPIAEVDRRFEEIVTELPDLDARNLDRFYLVPDRFSGLINHDRRSA